MGSGSGLGSGLGSGSWLYSLWLWLVTGRLGSSVLEKSAVSTSVASMARDTQLIATTTLAAVRGLSPQPTRPQTMTVAPSRGRHGTSRLKARR
eukprot:scaffold29507_cov36-Phaeocystis_antarctica.AAC.2